MRQAVLIRHIREEMILLSPEEIKEALRGIKAPSSTLELEEWFGGMDKFFMEVKRQVAKVQLKKVVEWGEEMCYDHNGAQRKEQNWYVKRRECPICWQALEEEIE